MKQYLKMADVFNACDVVETDVKVLYAVTEEYDDGVTPHEYAHHAIQYHDELVQINQELLEAPEAAVECRMVPISSAEEGGAVKYSIQIRVADQIRAAIAKAKGGAA